jgi:hypothetical protein
MAKGLRIGYAELKQVKHGRRRNPEDVIGIGYRHAFLEGKERSLCGQQIVYPTDIDWPGPGLGTPWCKLCLYGGAAQPTPL